MNLHLPQSVTTATELQELAGVSSQIISPRECKPIISVVQDIALGVFRLTKSNVYISDKQMMNLMSTNLKFDGSIPKPVYNKDGVQKWSGRQALSTIIPKNITLKTPNKNYEEGRPNQKDNFVIIENGEIIQGTVDKNIYQNRTRGLVHSIVNECGSEEARLFFDNTQKLICNWLVNAGFSVGISDLIVDDETKANLASSIREMKVKVYDMIKNIHLGKFDNKSINTNSEYFEDEVNNLLNKTREVVGKLALSKIDDNVNRMINMVKSGSKGSILNVSQMIACLGQQNVEGKRIAYGFDDRTLPHYVRYDDGPESRGFVENSFIKGLSPQEFFFHAMGGREGLIDTAVKSVTGDTEIIIIEDGVSKRLQIGEWIDRHMANARDNVKFFPKEKNMEMLYLSSDVYIPTCDQSGNMTWAKLTAVTRHDPSERLYEITTLAGRKVTVAESESLLVWNEETKEFQKTHSTKVNVGDFVPTTVSIPNPPIIKYNVDMTQYFPKIEYIYGTDFNKASKLMKNTMEGRGKIPTGWWAKNNGSEFTLPYSKKSSLARANSGRSNTSNIQDCCIYPYKATREHCLIPDRFELTRDNGIFIGLYLAEGSNCVKSGKVSISNVDQGVKSFAKSWFSKFSITYYEETKTNKIGGTSSSVHGSSTLLARFLDKFVGHGAHNKFVPDVAYTAPEEFVIGILNGYFTGDGSVSKNSIECGSASQKLTEGISMLCNRIGVFGKLFKTQTKRNNIETQNIAPSYRMSIRGQWAKVFATKVDILLSSKQTQLNEMITSDIHRNFNEINDVVMDKIVDINVIDTDIAKHSKLYDVTVPSTLNFAIANGLNVRDTSETGYLQRKLVKAMEDCKVNYDYTVRNASGSIVQFLYGEDGMDPVKIETQSFPYIDGYDYAKLCKDYLWTELDDTEFILNKDVNEKMKKEEGSLGDGLYQKLRKHFDKLVEDRHFLITKIFNYKQDTSIFYPVSFMRIITIAKSMFSQLDKGVLSDLDPEYVLDTIDTLCEELYVSKASKGNKFMNILLRCFLSPKKVAFDYKFSRTSFDWVVQQIKARFYDSIVHASESVGVVAAQSIGEPCTQLCVVYSARVLIENNSKPEYCEMGKMIDDLLVKNKNRVVDIGNGSSVLDLEEDDINIIGVSNDEKTSWRRISQVSRHPTKGNLLRVKTSSGREVTATLAHSFLKRTENGIEPIKGADLKVGDRIPVARYIPNIKNANDSVELAPSVTQKLTRDFGWFCGVYVADGSSTGNHISIAKVIPEYQAELRRIVKSLWNQDVKTNTYQGSGILNGWDMSKYEKANNTFRQPALSKYMKEQFGESCYIKSIPSWVFTAPLEFVQGFIGGYVDGDGNVNGIDGKGMIRTGSVCERLTSDFILLLTRAGIYASKCVEKHLKEENRKDIHTAQISRKYARKFKEEIGLIVDFKKNSLDDLINYVERDSCHSNAEQIDKIPEMASVLTTIGQGLKLDGQSRLYKRYEKKESIGRETLRKYYDTFTTAFQNRKKDLYDCYDAYGQKIKMLENHLDKATPSNRGIIELPDSIGTIISDMGRGKRSGGLGAPTGCGSMAQWKNLKTISQDTLKKFIDHFKNTSFNDYTTECEVLYNKVEPAIDKVKSALDADVIWDAIESLEVIPDPFEYVYDFTVPGNDSFMVDCGVLVHNTLNTFHSSGISSASKAVRGVPRIKELLSVTKNIKTPSMTIAIKPEYNQDKKKCTDILNSIQTIFFKDIVKTTKIYFDPDDYNTTIEDDKLFMASYKEFIDQGLIQASRLSPWLLRMEFDKQKLHEYNITMMDINSILTGHVNAMFSDDNANKLICRIKLEEDNNEERDYITELKALEKSILENWIVKGIEKVSKVVMTKKEYPRYNEETMQFDKYYEWIMDTSGTNLLEILGHPKVDSTKTISNDINEIYEIFGIEAARQALYNELSEVLVELYVNYRHIALLVDTMTNKGYLLSIDRHGINRVDIGPLAKCSFEETTDMLIKAGIFSETDKINGVSSNIMLGQIPPCGTGDTQIIIDENKLMDSILEETEDDKHGMDQFDELTKENMCGIQNLEFDFKLPEVTGRGQKVDVELKIV